MSLTHTADISRAAPGLMMVTSRQREGVDTSPAPLTCTGGRTIAVARAWTVVIVKV